MDLKTEKAGDGIERAKRRHKSLFAEKVQFKRPASGERAKYSICLLAAALPSIVCAFSRSTRKHSRRESVTFSNHKRLGEQYFRKKAARTQPSETVERRETKNGSSRSQKWQNEFSLQFRDKNLKAKPEQGKARRIIAGVDYGSSRSERPRWRVDGDKPQRLSLPPQVLALPHTK
jgi:hypothetical protein